MTNLELYLIFPLNNEESTIALVRGTMATGGIVLLGLLAAIPAVIFYNKLSADANRIVGGYEAFADEFSTILSRQLDAAA